MTPEELDEARAKEALHRLVNSGQVYCHEDIAALGARLAREGWTPPEPVDPDILAFREWAAKAWPIVSEAASGGHMDTSNYAQAFLAGARMAREQEAAASVERIKELEAENAALQDLAGRLRVEMSDMLTRLEERYPEDFVWLKEGDEPTDEARALLKESE